MNIIDAIILGIVQGFTEFLPVSSSGHLKLTQHLLGLQDLDKYLLFDLACHLGTLFAIVCFFFQALKELPSRWFQVLLGTLPLFPLVLVVKPIYAAYASPNLLGFFFLVTGCILFLGVLFGKTKEVPYPSRDALAIGCWQALAILPGVSRSGSTISGARLLGWNPREAVTFSFLLAIPAILGATCLELMKLWRHPEEVANLAMEHYIIGFGISFAVGLLALRLLLFAALHNKFAYFGWYCVVLGFGTIWYFHG